MILTFKGYTIQGTPKEISEFLSINGVSVDLYKIKKPREYSLKNSLEKFYGNVGCDLPQEIKNGTLGYIDDSQK